MPLQAVTQDHISIADVHDEVLALRADMQRMLFLFEQAQQSVVGVMSSPTLKAMARNFGIEL